MLHSMTAFGRGEAGADGYRFTIELRTLNHRFCDIRIKLPRKYSDFEEDIKKRVSSKFSRGRIEVSVLADDTLDKVQHLTVDTELAKTYKRLLLILQEELGLEGDLRLESLLNFRDLFAFQEDEESRGKAWRAVETALDQAVSNCLLMRKEEGEAMTSDLSRRLHQLEVLTGEVETRAPLVVQDVRDRLQKRIQDLLGEAELDEARLAQEVAFFAEKSDINEELVRLQSHIRQFSDLLEAEGPRGRQLEFLLQEMHREVNTIGSKTNDLEIAQKVIQMKTELERFREQLQNVE
ncbi:MAG: YicC family protein [Deltaproteobacteria bacterium]|nr:YicC family protein [Deltaproteobacteria bacterium]MDH3852372.1 YicC family protein [Deltaproteobacteria bacterium]MDH3897768.1 YicC family protein [Deltaproteobacteria bacterium]MDH3927734.1 YicC family protein [Deltaproteobacteria bacterium]MDH3952113.1 YicC family protein [Deltaproteobacteria bacterium]